MPSVGMVGQNGREMIHEFTHMLDNHDQAKIYHMTDCQQNSPMVDVLVVSDASSKLDKLISCLVPGGYLVVNADDREIFPYLPSGAKLITYGFSNKACITASSVADDRLHICIQRAFTALSGDVRDPQEFSAISIISPEAALGAAAVWAICSMNVNVSA